MFKTGYILNPKHDLVWFLGLPFFAVALALGFQAWLPYMAVASINLWITIPHHYAGWVRSGANFDELRLELLWSRVADFIAESTVPTQLSTASSHCPSN